MIALATKVAAEGITTMTCTECNATAATEDMDVRIDLDASIAKGLSPRSPLTELVLTASHIGNCADNRRDNELDSIRAGVGYDHRAATADQHDYTSRFAN